MSDIRRYGAAELGGAFYYVRESPSGMSSAQIAATYYVDGLGETIRIASADGWTREQIAELPTLEQAVARHLAPAFSEADANHKAWLRHREDVPEPEPEPAPMDLATSRFLGGS